MSNQYSYWAIDDGFGNEITSGLEEAVARTTAQRMANERGESVWLYEAGRQDRDEDAEIESEEIEPE